MNLNRADLKGFSIKVSQNHHGVGKGSGRKKRAAKLKRILLSWHKRLGIVSAVFVLLLSVTGILLNHTSALHFGRVPAPKIVLGFYVVKTPHVTGALVAKEWFLHANGSLYLNNPVFSPCSQHLVGAVELNNFNIIACSEELLLLTDKGELVERISAPLGSHSKQNAKQNAKQNLEAASDTDHRAIAVCSSKLCLQTRDDNVYSFDLDDFDVQRIPKDEQSQILWSNLVEVPPAIVKSWAQEHIGREITWERLILDLHAGRFFGAVGPWFMDFIALVFIILAATGTYLWSRKDRKIQNRS